MFSNNIEKMKEFALSSSSSRISAKIIIHAFHRQNIKVKGISLNLKIAVFVLLDR